MIRSVLKIGNDPAPARKAERSLHLEKRRCARVSIDVPVSCRSLDEKNRPYDQNRGIVRNVSRTGLRIEAENDVCSDRLRLTLETVGQTIAAITGRVVFSQKTAAGTFKIGVQLQGDKPEVTRFVSRLVRYHHYTKSRTSSSDE